METIQRQKTSLTCHTFAINTALCWQIFYKISFFNWIVFQFHLSSNVNNLFWRFWTFWKKFFFKLFHGWFGLRVVSYDWISFCHSVFPLLLYVFTFYILSYCFLLLFSSFKCLLLSIVSFCFRVYENWNRF
jgi:hypothetical protein